MKGHQEADPETQPELLKVCPRVGSSVQNIIPVRMRTQIFITSCNNSIHYGYVLAPKDK